MEFNALPSQGAGSSHNPSDSKKETAEGFEKALEKALAESGMAIGIPSFVQNEAELPLTELDIPRSETTQRKPDSVEAPLRRVPQNQGESDDLDWKALEAKNQGDSSSKGNDNAPAGQGNGDKSTAGSMNQGSAPAGNQLQQPALSKLSNEVGGSTQGIQGAKAGASKISTTVKASGQLADRILQIVTRMNEQGQKVHKAVMRLRPEKLGLLEIELKLEDGRLNVRLVAAQAEAREMLQGELEKIRGVLSEQGFDAIDMQLENGKQDQKGEESSREVSTDWEPESIDTENESIRTWDGLVDLLA